MLAKGSTSTILMNAARSNMVFATRDVNQHGITVARSTALNWSALELTCIQYVHACDRFCHVENSKKKRNDIIFQNLNWIVQNWQMFETLLGDRLPTPRCSPLCYNGSVKNKVASPWRMTLTNLMLLWWILSSRNPPNKRIHVGSPILCACHPLPLALWSFT